MYVAPAVTPVRQAVGCLAMWPSSASLDATTCDVYVYILYSWFAPFVANLHLTLEASQMTIKYFIMCFFLQCKGQSN